jgi:hypothetical protein
MQMLSKIKIKKLTESDMQALCIVFQPAIDFVPTTQTDPLNCVYAIVAGLYKSIESKIQSFYLNPGKKYSLKLSTADCFAVQTYLAQHKTSNPHTMAVLSHFNTSINQQLISITPMKKY